MWKDVRDWVKTCDPCQRSQGSRFFESLQPIHEEMPFWRVVLDCVKLMPPSHGMSYAAIARDALSGYPEVKTFAQPTSEGITKTSTKAPGVDGEASRAGAGGKERPNTSSRRVCIWPLHTCLLYNLLYTPSEHLRQYSKAPGALFSVHGNQTACSADLVWLRRL